MVMISSLDVDGLLNGWRFEVNAGTGGRRALEDDPASGESA
jgi:hypothetical protein